MVVKVLGTRGSAGGGRHRGHYRAARCGTRTAGRSSTRWWTSTGVPVAGASARARRTRGAGRHVKCTSRTESRVLRGGHSAARFAGSTSSSAPATIVTSEVRLIPASDARLRDPLRGLVHDGRSTDYEVDHQGDRFVIRTNDRHKNSRASATAPADDPTEAGVGAAGGRRRTHHHIRGNLNAFQDFIAVEERIEGLDQLRLIDRVGGFAHTWTFPEPVPTQPGLERQRRSSRPDTVRLEYTSLVTPSDGVRLPRGLRASWRSARCRRFRAGTTRQEYVTERLVLATARDGAYRCPRRLIRRKDTPVDGSGAAVRLRLTGRTVTADSARRSRPRGCRCWTAAFIYAIAHIRGRR